MSLNADTLNANIAEGGAGGTGGTGGNGGLAGGLSGFARIGGVGKSGGAPESTSTSISIGAASGGPGGNGGSGGQGTGGAFYVVGGALTLFNLTVADDAVRGGAGGSGGAGGKGGSFSQGNGTAGQTGSSGSASGGGFYIDGGSVSIDNSTVALDKQSGVGGVGGVVQIAGTVNATSTLFAGNGTVDYSGPVTANYCLFQTTPINGKVNATNLVSVNPLLAVAGLASNGGPTKTIALQTNSPAIGKGTNPENLFTDQRGGPPRTGSGGTDIGAFQHNATADTAAPTSSVSAPNVTVSGSTTYTFTITYTDNVAIAAATLASATVQVVPPAGMGPITATVTSTKSVGSTDALGDAKEFIVTYKITPPGGKWASSDNGTYAVTLRGAPIADLAGNTVAAGVISRFSVQIPNVLAGTSQTPSSLMAGATFGLKVAVEGNLGHVQTSFIGPVAICLANNPGEGTLDGTYDPKAILPSPYHVLALDAGIHGFGVTFSTAGKQSIMVVDTVKASITSTASVTVTACCAGRARQRGLDDGGQLDRNLRHRGLRRHRRCVSDRANADQ